MPHIPPLSTVGINALKYGLKLCGPAASRTSAAFARASTSLAPALAASRAKPRASVSWRGSYRDGNELALLEQLHSVPYSAATALIYIYFCGREGLHGVGTYVSGDQRPNSQAGEPLGRLNPGTPSGFGAGVLKRLHRRAFQIDYHKEGSPSKPWIYRRIEPLCRCSYAHFHKTPHPFCSFKSSGIYALLGQYIYRFC